MTMMKGAMSWSAVALVSVCLLAGYVRCAKVDCDCSYHPGGCAINVAAPEGFKCKCSYKGFWTCGGVAFPCLDTDHCPGNVADYCACKTGGGDCDGYKNPNNNCPKGERPKDGVAASADCDCSYHPGGCSIKSPAPLGWKCVCSYKGFWTCSGWAQQCSKNEICLGNDYSYCACRQGGGDCDGYPDRPSNCPSAAVPTSCNCDRPSDWNKGHYTVEQVTYEIGNNKIQALQPITLGEKDIRNYSGETQSITLNIQESLSKTSSFSHTAGIAISAGVEFKTGLPIVAEGTATLSVTASYAHTWGKSETIDNLYRSAFTCNGAPRKHTQCSVIMQKGKVEVPYTMQVKHKFIPNCACQSKGVWSGVQAYNAKLVSKEVGVCSGNTCT